MPKLINVPNEGVISFPDSMGDEEIAGVIKTKFFSGSETKTGTESAERKSVNDAPYGVETQDKPSFDAKAAQTGINAALGITGAIRSITENPAADEASAMGQKQIRLDEQAKASDAADVAASLNRNLPKTGEQSTVYGGPPKKLATYAETMESLQEADSSLFRTLAPRQSLGEPRIGFQFNVDPKEGWASAALKESANTILSVPEFFTSDLGVATILTTQLAPALVSAGFSVDMAKATFDHIQQTTRDWDKLTPAQRSQAFVRGIATALFATAAMTHTGKAIDKRIIQETTPAGKVSQLLEDATTEEFTPKPDQYNSLAMRGESMNVPPIGAVLGDQEKKNQMLASNAQLVKAAQEAIPVAPLTAQAVAQQASIPFEAKPPEQKSVLAEPKEALSKSKVDVVQLPSLAPEAFKIGDTVNFSDLGHQLTGKIVNIEPDSVVIEHADGTRTKVVSDRTIPVRKVGENESPPIPPLGELYAEPKESVSTPETKAVDYAYSSPESKAWWEEYDRLNAERKAVAGTPEHKEARAKVLAHEELAYGENGDRRLVARRLDSNRPLANVNSPESAYGSSVMQGHDLTGWRFSDNWDMTDDGVVFRRVVSPDGTQKAVVLKDTLHALEKAELQKNTEEFAKTSETKGEQNAVPIQSSVVEVLRNEGVRGEGELQRMGEKNQELQKPSEAGKEGVAKPSFQPPTEPVIKRETNEPVADYFNRQRDKRQKHKKELAAWGQSLPENERLIFKDSDPGRQFYQVVLKDPEGGWRIAKFMQLWKDEPNSLAPWGHDRYKTRLEALDNVGRGTERVEKLPTILSEDEVKSLGERKNEEAKPPPSQQPVVESVPEGGGVEVNPFDTLATSERLTDLQKSKPRPINKLYGPNPTEEQIASQSAKIKAWNKEYRKAQKDHKQMVKKSNDWIQNQSQSPSTPVAEQPVEAKTETPATPKTGDAIESPTPKPTEEPTKPIGMGDSAGPGTGEGPGSPTGKQGPDAGTSGFQDQSGRDIYGVAQRVREQRAKAGQVAPVQSGKGVSPAEVVKWGQDLIANGVNAEQSLKNFEQDPGKSVSVDLIAVTRAHGEALAKAASDVESKFGTDSVPYRTAKAALDSWDARSKKIDTAAGDALRSLQGHTDIDTGTFTGLNRAYRDITGKDLDPSQTKSAKRIAKGVTDADKKATEGVATLQTEIDKIGEPIEPAIRRLADKIIKAMDDRAKSALDRIKARQAEGKAFSGGLDPRDLDDVIIYGAAKITKGVVEFAAWSAEMIADIGEGIRPYLKKVYDDSVKYEDRETTKLAGGESNKEKVKAAKRAPKAPSDLNEQRKSFQDYKSGQKMTDDQLRTLWSRAKSEYIDKGNEDMADTVNKLATDLGLPVNDVLRGLNQSRSVKRVADDVWQKQRQARLLKQSARRWVENAQKTWLQKTIPAAARFMFSAKVAGHGAVAIGTHAPLVMATNPIIGAKNFGKMYKMIISPDYYRMESYKLKNRPNYDVAQRAKLVNDPSKMEDFNDPLLAQRFPKMAEFFRERLGKLKVLQGAGTRGYTVLKLLRQDLFDQHWDKLSESEKTPELAKAIAATVNHITGVTETKLPDSASLALFAPKLLYSRMQLMAGDPIRAANSMLKMGNITPEEKWFALNQVKEKAKIFGVFTGLLAANQQLNNWFGDKKKLNGVPEFMGGAGFNPMSSDFMKFRAAGMNVAWASPFLTLSRLPMRLIQIGMGDGGKAKFIIYPDESMYKTLGSYARTQTSPALSPVLSLLMKGDYENRPLPQIPGYGPPPPVPGRLKAKGIKPYTWPEFAAQTFLPIPAQEAAKEVWHYGLGSTPEQQKALLKAFTIITLMAGTGGRIQEDWPETTKGGPMAPKAPHAPSAPKAPK